MRALLVSAADSAPYPNPCLTVLETRLLRLPLTRPRIGRW